uniref:Uncharacterized protein n=1 Tax=Arundo donax TaxID=35708 RepID=A0A0A9DQA1_ARUDO
MFSSREKSHPYLWSWSSLFIVWRAPQWPYSKYKGYTVADATCIGYPCRQLGYCYCSQNLPGERHVMPRGGHIIPLTCELVT